MPTQVVSVPVCLALGPGHSVAALLAGGPSACSSESGYWVRSVAASMRAFGGWTTLTQSSVCPGSILVAGIWMKLMHVSSRWYPIQPAIQICRNSQGIHPQSMFSVLSFRPGLWPEEGGHLVEVTCHPQKLRLLSEQAGKPTSAVHSTAQGALSCIKTIQGTLLTPTRCIDLTRSLDALVRGAINRNGSRRYMDCCLGGFLAGFVVFKTGWVKV